MSEERTTFVWRIENYSYCWHRNGEELVSPEFTADGLEGTVWTLNLYPRGERREDEGCVSLFLNRCEVDDGPSKFSVKYELSILAEKGSCQSIDDFDHSFRRGGGYGCDQFLETDDALLLRTNDYLPQDTLSVQCKIWKGEGDVKEVTEINARTRIGIEEISFIHLIENFSKMELNEMNIHIKNSSKKEHALTSSLHFIDACSEGTIMLKITPSEDKQILSKCKISLLDRYDKKIECGESDSRLDATRKDIQNLSLSLSRQAILNRKADYLPNDNLCFFCECIFSTGVEYQKIERTFCKIPLNFYNEMSKNFPHKGAYNAVEKFSTCPSVLDDLKAAYFNRLLADAELKTKTKSFPAHKIWLCARSPVFKTMLTSSTRKKNVIPVDDLEDDTVQQLLTFLYTDELGELCWESARKLYHVGDKYQIQRLKLICSSFLLDNVSAASAGELLILANTHTDSDLKHAVEDFILLHDDEVFGSNEWKTLSDINSQLALETMLLKYGRKSLINQQ